MCKRYINQAHYKTHKQSTKSTKIIADRRAEYGTKPRQNRMWGEGDMVGEGGDIGNDGGGASAFRVVGVRGCGARAID